MLFCFSLISYSLQATSQYSWQWRASLLLYQCYSFFFIIFFLFFFFLFLFLFLFPFLLSFFLFARSSTEAPGEAVKSPFNIHRSQTLHLHESFSPYYQWYLWQKVLCHFSLLTKVHQLPNTACPSIVYYSGSAERGRERKWKCKWTVDALLHKIKWLSEHFSAIIGASCFSKRFEATLRLRRVSSLYSKSYCGCNI